MAAAPDWSNGLPTDILCSILERLPAADYVRFGCVCVWWCSAVKERRCRSAPGLPWLLLSPDDHNNHDPDHDSSTTDCTFLCLSYKKKYVIRNPINHDLPLEQDQQQRLHWKGCIGSSPDGWLCLLDKRDELHVWNPITRTQITALPSIAPRSNKFRYLQAVVTTTTASSSSSSSGPTPSSITPPTTTTRSIYVVVLLFDSYDLLGVAFARPEDKVWTMLDTKYDRLLPYDLTVHEGKLYGFSIFHTNVLIFDFNHDPPVVTEIHTKGRVRLHGPADYYMVGMPGGCCGDLPLLVRVQKVDGPIPRVQIFRLYRHSRTSAAWVKVKSLGDHALILSKVCDAFSVVCLSTRDSPELRRNCIYYPRLTREGYEFRSMNLEGDGIEESSNCLRGVRWPETSSSPIFFTPSVL